MFGKKKRTDQYRQSRVPQSLERDRTYLYHSSRSLRPDDETGLGRNLRPEAILDERARALSDRPRRLVTALLTLLMIACIAGSLYLGGSVTVVTVGEEAASKTFLRDRKVYEDAANAAFGSLLNRNKITVNTNRISGDLERRFPELQAVTISLPVIGSKPVVYVHPSPPKLIFVAGGGTYLLDGKGRALITGNQVPSLESLHVPVVNDQTGLPVELGSVVLPEATVSFIGEVVGQLNAKGITTTSLILPPGSTELYVKMDGADYYVKYDLHGNAREEVGAYLAVRRYLEASGKVPNEYIDVRVVNKVYYR